MRARRRGEGNSCRHCRRPHRRREQGNLKVAWTLRNNIGRKLVLNEGDAILEKQLALLEALNLQQIRARRGFERRNSSIEVAVLLQEPRQLRPQLTFFLFSHRNR